MKLELDHFFILVKPHADVANRLISIGMKEGEPNTHPGQGTANRRFYFSNSMLELLWIRDEIEANNGPGSKLNFPKRVSDQKSSPFGIILLRKNDSDTEMPFSGWPYQPDYFPAPQAFHIGDNSNILHEPLCIYVPFATHPPRKTITQSLASIEHICISVPCETLSDTLLSCREADRVKIQSGDAHLIEIFFTAAVPGRRIDLRPDIPVIIYD